MRPTLIEARPQAGKLNDKRAANIACQQRCRETKKEVSIINRWLANWTTSGSAKESLPGPLQTEPSSDQMCAGKNSLHML